MKADLFGKKNKVIGLCSVSSADRIKDLKIQANDIKGYCKEHKLPEPILITNIGVDSDGYLNNTDIIINTIKYYKPSKMIISGFAVYADMNKTLITLSRYVNEFIRTDITDEPDVESPEQKRFERECKAAMKEIDKIAKKIGKEITIDGSPVTLCYVAAARSNKEPKKEWDTTAEQSRVIMEYCKRKGYQKPSLLTRKYNKEWELADGLIDCIRFMNIERIIVADRSLIGVYETLIRSYLDNKVSIEVVNEETLYVKENTKIRKHKLESRS